MTYTDEEKNAAAMASQQTEPAGEAAGTAAGRPAGEAAGTTSAPRWYETLFRQENERPDLSDEEKRRMERRERAARAIAGLGDVATHIANIVYTGKGAAPAQPSTTISDNVRNAWEHINQKADVRRQAFRQGLAAARQMDYRQFLDDRKQQLAEAKEERAREKARWDDEYRQSRRDLDNAKLELLKAKSEDDRRLAEKRIELLEAQAAYNKARAEGRIPTGSRRGSSRTSSDGGGKYTTPGGKSYSTVSAYHTALIEEAMALDPSIVSMKEGRPHVSDYAMLEYAIKEARSRKGLPRTAGASGAAAGQPAGNAAGTAEKPAGEAAGKRDWSKYKI